ncbi:MAG: hypothetical protein HWN80_09680 [Candidatus Lokiarchaeota archaeon]|nr:hypothetical protein [Candidatus Lokiarchaeota archaeon]
MFNFRDIFRIGIYDIEDDYSSSYTDGTAGINLHLNINHGSYESYVINTVIESISTGNVVNYGLLSIIIYCLKNNDPVFARSVQFGAPSSTYPVNNIPLKLAKHDNLTCYGTIEMSLETGGVPMNDTINFQLTYIIPLGLGDFSSYDLLIDFLFPSHFLLYIIVPVVLIWIFKPVFGLRFTKEDLERDEKFLEYLQNPPSRKRKESEN